MIQIGFEIPGDNPVSRMISGFDAPGKFSHCAIWLAPDLVNEAHIDFGVKFRKYVPDPARWKFAIPTFNYGSDEEDRYKADIIREFLELETGAKYDTCGVLAMARLPFAKEDPEKWYCSELVTAAVQKVGLFPDLVPHKVSPNALYLACVQAGLVEDDQ